MIRAAASRVAGNSSNSGRRCLAGLALVAVFSGVAGCAPAPVAEDRRAAGGEAAAGRQPTAAVDIGLDNLNAVLWVQTAVEYRANSRQAYALAARVLDEALADRGWTAFLGQTGRYEDLPPAIILDIDETVLDNSYYEARLVLDNAVYSSDTWDTWVLQEAATAIPGAVELIDLAAGKGVAVFFVTNRREHLEDATRTNLGALGIALDESTDTVLMRGENPEWESSNKTPRWATVAATYRILMMFGDSMGDFTAAAEGTVAERRAFAEAHRDYWGSKWITLANPTYGSFIGAVLDDDFSLSVEQQNERKRQALDPKR